MAKINSDKLFSLIRSLSTSDRRLVKVSLELAAKSKHAHLYRLILDSKSINETEILATLYGKSSKSKSAYSQLKKYLYDHICDVLVVWDNQSSVWRKIQFQLHKAEALFKRGLYVESMKILQEQSKIAENFEVYDLVAQIWRKRISWALMMNDVDLLQKIDSDFLASWNHAKELTQYESSCWKEYASLLSLLKRSNQVNENKRPAFSKNIDGCTLANIYRLQAEGMFAFSRKEYLVFRTNFEQAQTFFEQNSNLIAENPEVYLEVCSKCVSGAFACFDFEEALNRAEKFKNAIETTSVNKNLKSVHCENYYLYLLTICNTSGKFEKGIQTITEIRKKRPKFHTGKYAVTILYNYISLYFVAGHLSETQKWVSYLNNVLDKNKNERNDLRKSLRWIELFLHIDLGNTEILESLTRSIGREIKKDLHYNPTIVEKAVYKLVRNILANQTSETKIFQDFFDEVESALSDPKERFIQNYFHILSWASSHITGNSFAQEAERRLCLLTPIR